MKLTVINDFPIYPPRFGGQFRIYNLYRNLSKYCQINYISYEENILFPEYYSLRQGFNGTKIPKSRIQKELELLGGRLYPQSSINDIVALLFSHADPTFRLELRNSSRNSDVLVATHPYLYRCIENERKIKVYESLNVEYLLKQSIFDSYIDSSILTSLVYEIEKKACEGSNIILAVSEEDRLALSKNYLVSLDKIYVVPNGVETKSIISVNDREKKEAKRNFGIETESIILFVGSAHSPNKDAAVNVLELAKKNNEKKFIIVGSVGYLLKDMDIPPNVRITSEVDEETKLSLYKVSDIALNPMTRGSGTNLKMLDYLAAGIPTISTTIGVRGLDIVNGEHAIVSDIENFNDNLLNLSKDKDLYQRLRNNGRRLVEEKYDWGMIANRLLEILKNQVKESEDKKICAGNKIFGFGDYFSSVVGSNNEVIEFDKDEFKVFVKEFEPYCQNSNEYFDKIHRGNEWPKHLPTLEKKFEYFVTTKLQPLTSADVYCDLASCLSLFPDYISEHTGATTYRQNLFYKHGIHGRCIGGDASSLPVGNGFFTAMTCHCSLEHFEGDSDIRLMKEVSRVLKSGGTLLVLPFYCGMAYEEINLEKEVPGCRFRRYYSPEMFKERFTGSLSDFKLTLYEIANLKEIDDSLYCKLILKIKRL